MYEYNATISRVIDGDTIVVEVDLGFRVRIELTLRLEGLNCPEKSTEEGKRSLAYVKQWCSTNQKVRIVTSKNPEKYGRWLAQVYDKDGNTLNSALLREKLAIKWDGKGLAPVN